MSTSSSTRVAMIWTRPPGGGEGNGVIHQIFYDTEQPLLIAHHDRDAASGAGKSYAYIIGNISRLPRPEQPFDGVAQIDRIVPGAGKQGVDARHFGDIRHKTHRKGLSWGKRVS